MIDIIKELLIPANREALYIVLGFLAIVTLFVMALVAYLAHKGTLSAGRKIGPIYIQVRAANAADQFAPKPSGYRKLLYVKVTHLTERTPTAAPVYIRTIERLEPSERNVPIYDEAVYYALEMLPSIRLPESRTDSSSGAIDARIFVPWQDQIRFQQEATAAVAKLAQIDIDRPTDTVLTVSHFENGLQANHQDFMTFVTEDAEEVRLVVDFSSVPGADNFVTLKNAFLDRKTDNTSQVVGAAPIAPGLFVVSSKDAKKGDVLRINVTIDWTRAPKPTT